MPLSMQFEVILDIGETPNKCTIAPLAYRPDFKLFPVKGATQWGPLTSPVLLHHEGECITKLRETLPPVSGIASVDCVWRRLNFLLDRIVVRSNTPPITRARIPEGFVTAYPRVSEFDTDPDGGLATIEAIFTAAALFGNWDVSLLSEYYFGRKYVELNQKRFVECGVAQASDTALWPVMTPRVRNALTRKQGRGKA